MKLKSTKSSKLINFYTVIILTLFQTQELTAQWSTSLDNPLEISPFGTCYPGIVSAGENGYWVGLHYYHNSAHIQHITVDGQVVYSPYPLRFYWTRNYLGNASIQMISDGEGGVITSLHEQIIVDTVGLSYFIYKDRVKLQRINNNGNLLWGIDTIPLWIHQTTKFQGGGQIVTGNFGSTFVLWFEMDTSIYFPVEMNPTSLYLQKLGPAGQKLWDETRTIVADTLDTGQIGMIPDGTGGVIIQWQQQMIQRFNSEGQALWSAPIQINGFRAEVIRSDKSGGVFIVGRNQNESVNFPYQHQLKAQRINSQGELVWQPSDGVVIIDSLQTPPSLRIILSSLPDTTLIIGWQRPIPPESFGYYGFIQAITPEGQVLLDGFGISMDTMQGPFGTLYHIIDSNEDSTLITVWAGGDSTIRVNKYDYALNPIWSTPTVAGRSAAGNSNKVASDGAGGVVVVWANGYNGSDGVFAQQVNANGELGVVLNNTVPEKPPVPATLHLSRPYPNPFNNQLVIPYTLPQTALLDISIYNILGQEIWHTRYQPQTAGTHTLTWRADNVSSGIYLLQLKSGQTYAVQKLTLLK